MTTLLEELGHSAYLYDKYAREAKTIADRADHLAFASRLRARAERIRELLASWEGIVQWDEKSVPVLVALRALTGPLDTPETPGKKETP